MSMNNEETLVRWEVWGPGKGESPVEEWRGSGRVRVPAEMTPAEAVGEASRRLHAAGMLFVGDRFRFWVAGGWSASGTLDAGDGKQLSVAAKIEERHQGTEAPRQEAGELKCLVPWCLFASVPSLAAMGDETMWAWFLIGALFGVVAWAALKVFENWDRLKAEFAEDRLNGPLNGEGLRERLHARDLTDEEHREMLLQCHAAAMLHPLNRVDIRGIPVMWGLSAEQRERFLEWLAGETVAWDGGEWLAWVSESAGFRFIAFGEVSGIAEKPTPLIEAREETAKVIVSKGRARS